MHLVSNAHFYYLSMRQAILWYIHAIYKYYLYAILICYHNLVQSVYTMVYVRQDNNYHTYLAIPTLAKNPMKYNTIHQYRFQPIY